MYKAKPGWKGGAGRRLLLLPAAPGAGAGSSGPQGTWRDRGHGGKLVDFGGRLHPTWHGGGVWVVPVGSGPWGRMELQGEDPEGSPAKPTGNLPASCLLSSPATRNRRGELKARPLQPIYLVDWVKLHLKAVVSND